MAHILLAVWLAACFAVGLYKPAPTVTMLSIESEADSLEHVLEYSRIVRLPIEERRECPP